MTIRDCIRTRKHADALITFSINMQMPGDHDAEHWLKILKLTAKEEDVSMKVLYEVFTGKDTGLPLSEMLAIMEWDWVLQRVYERLAWITLHGEELPEEVKHGKDNN